MLGFGARKHFLNRHPRLVVKTVNTLFEVINGRLQLSRTAVYLNITNAFLKYFFIFNSTANLRHSYFDKYTLR